MTLLLSTATLCEDAERAGADSSWKYTGRRLRKKWEKVEIQDIPVGMRIYLSPYDNYMHQYRLGDNLLKRNSAEKDLGLLVVYRLAFSQQCALVSQWYSGVY